MKDQGDVFSFQTDDGGDVIIENGTTQLTAGLETTVYLSMFGGNEQDPGGQDKKFTWWGNLSETDVSRQYRSETQYLLKSLPVTSGNLKRIENAALRDLSWMLSGGVASDLSVYASIPARNRVTITAVIEARGERSEFTFAANWEASA